MVHLKVGDYTCGCSKDKCDRDCITYRHLTHTESNADRIRTMKDEELAEWLDAITAKAQAYGYECADSCPNDCPLPEDWLSWLKEEVEA